MKTAEEILRDKLKGMAGLNRSHWELYAGFNSEVTFIKKTLLAAMEEHANQYRSQQGEDKWVDCERELPESEKPVLICYMANKKRTLLVLDETVYYKDGDWYEQNNGWKLVVTVTHWQPLPPAPKQS